MGKTNISISIDTDLLKEIDERAKHRKLNRSQFIEEMCEEHLYGEGEFGEGMVRTCHWRGIAGTINDLSSIMKFDEMPPMMPVEIEIRCNSNYLREWSRLLVNRKAKQ